MSSKSNLAIQYQKKTDKEHILDNPDTYIGSVENVDTEGYLFDNTVNGLVQKQYHYIPGLYKLFDEAIVNCRDHAIRIKQAMASCKSNTLPLSYIDVSIGDDGTMSFTNDGNGIDVEKHPTYDIWIPEMIFAHLRTGTNYNKEEKKIVGGKNGFGAKLIFIWSLEGELETVDHVRGLKFTQKYGKNLDVIEPPVIKKFRGKPYTRISFKPDYPRLEKTGLSSDEIALFKKRVYDIAAVTDKAVKVKFNGELVPVRDFQQYADLYIGGKDDAKRAYEKDDERWEYIVALSPTDEFTQVSFVNGIYTSKGGKHVDYILNQIIRKLVAYIQKKRKIDVKPTTIKEQLMLFMRCDIENPAFDSQTKDYMNTPSTKFGSTCTVSDKFIEKVAKLGVMDAACALTEVKQNKTAKKSDGMKVKSIRGIPKLVDANFAGTADSHKCTVIFCEGDSAKAGIISGLSKDDRNIIGVYPMKGKLFNVRGETISRISENKEIIEIKQILGLETDKVYESEAEIKNCLRYGKILFMTDQDLDGSHIKGLGINLFQSQWASIAKHNIIGFMNTPILKAKKGSQELVFYNDGEYETWKQANNDGKGWKVKYYKGLGTSTSKEFKEYFERKKIVNFKFTDKSDDAIDMVFNKKRADDRKEWLGNYDRSLYLDTSHQDISFEDFIYKEMIHFSKYDCERSIPNLMDGLKISLRKILYSGFKKRLNSEIKVAQFSGYVSEHSGYHHGEASLNGAIVGMAQDYVGSNNINLLMPNGQFGTRLSGGKDSASERYIFTELNPVTRHIYPEIDDKILKYLDDDGQLVEPIYYAPIIPMVLVNGSKGIGTGFSTDVMCYKPHDLIGYLLNKLQGKDTTSAPLLPYYEGFKGTIEPLDGGKYVIKGVYEKMEGDRIRITELPIGSWTDDYKKFLEDLIDNKKSGSKKKSNVIVRDYSDMSTDKIVDITVQLAKGTIESLESETHEYNLNGIEKHFKLYTTNSTSNMHMFDASEKLKLYKNVYEIIDDYFETRMALYIKRKQYIIDSLNAELIVLSNRAKYIQENLNDTIDLRRKKKDDIIALLKSKNYDIVDEDEDYKYLVKMPMDSVSEENVERIMKSHDEKMKELELCKKTSEAQMWMNELKTLNVKYNDYKTTREKSMSEKAIVKKKKKLNLKK
jgi:DNA topoisomerase-2